jgi:hypothetical protein
MWCSLPFLATATFGKQSSGNLPITQKKNQQQQRPQTIAFSTSCSPGNNASTPTSTVRHPTAFLWAKAVFNSISRVYITTLLVVSFIPEAGSGLEHYYFDRLLYIIPFLLPFSPVSLFYYFYLNKTFPKKKRGIWRSLCA